MRIDVAKNSGKATGVLSRCRVCGRYFTWECPTRMIYVDVKTGKKKATVEPDHCGSSVCTDFMMYFHKCRQKEAVDFEFAKYMYLKRKGVM